MFQMVVSFTSSQSPIVQSFVLEFRSYKEVAKELSRRNAKRLFVGLYSDRDYLKNPHRASRSNHYIEPSMFGATIQVTFMPHGFDRMPLHLPTRLRIERDIALHKARAMRYELWWSLIPDDEYRKEGWCY